MASFLHLFLHPLEIELILDEQLLQQFFIFAGPTYLFRILAMVVSMDEVCLFLIYY